MQQHIKDHLSQNEVYHHQIQADSFLKLKQAVHKNSASLQCLLQCTSDQDSYCTSPNSAAISPISVLPLPDRKKFWSYPHEATTCITTKEDMASELVSIGSVTNGASPKTERIPSENEHEIPGKYVYS